MVLLNRANKKPVLFSFLAFLLAVPFGCSTAESPDKPPPAVVKWQELNATALTEWTEIVGTTTPLPNHSTRISTRVEGTVAAVFPSSPDKMLPWVLGGTVTVLLPKAPDKPAAEGDKVENGTVLVQLKTTTVMNSLGEAKRTQASVAAEQKQAQLAVEPARRELDRLTKLVKEDERRAKEDPKYVPLISPVQLENAATALKDAESKLTGADAKWSAGEKRVEALQEQLRQHTLASPIAGRLGRIQVVPGQWLAVGTPVADVLDIDDEIDVLCYVPPSVINRLQVGQYARNGPIEAETTDADGEIVFIADLAEPETGNFAVKIRLSNKTAKLRANQVLRLSIKTNVHGECLNIKEAAVQEDSETPTVIAVLEEKRKNEKGEEETVYVAHKMEVVLGVRDRQNHLVEILSLTDADKEAKKKVQISVKEAKIIFENGQGVQTGDLLKEDTGDD